MGGEPAIYRASARGIERLVGVGEVTANSEMITQLRGLAANAKGHVLFYGATPSSSGLFLRRNGALEQIVAEDEQIGSGERVTVIHEFALTDDDEVLFSAILGVRCCGRSLLAWRNGEVRLVVKAHDSTLTDTLIDDVRELNARGSFALFRASTTASPVLHYDAAAAQITHVVSSGDAVLHGGWSPEGASVLANGDVGVPYYFQQDSTIHRGFLLLRANGTQDFPFSEALEAADTRTLAFNERGNALLRSYLSTAGAARYALLRTGAGPAESGCPTNRTLVPAAPLLPTPTATPTAPPQATRTPGDGIAEIEIEPVTAAAGTRAEIRIVLHDGGSEVAGTQNDIAFPPEVTIAATAGGVPDCTVNPDIRKPNTGYVFLPNSCELSACNGFRAIVISVRNTFAIPDGSVLYTCRIDIAPDAEPGTYELRLSNVGVGSPIGDDIDTVGRNGIVTVPSAEEDRSLDEASTVADGCQVQSRSASPAAWWLIGTSPLWLWRRRQRTMRQRRSMGRNLK